MTEQELAELIVRGIQGDETAWAALYAACSPAILHLALGLLGNLADAEEVTQDTFVYALSRLAHFDARKSAFTTWLYTIALSRCRNKRRRRWLVVLPFEGLSREPHTGEREIERVLEWRGVRRQVWQAIQTLPTALREAVVLRYVAGLRYKEIGATVGCNAKTAESRVRLGVTALRRVLKAHYAELEVEWAEAV